MQKEETEFRKAGQSDGIEGRKGFDRDSGAGVC